MKSSLVTGSLILGLIATSSPVFAQTEFRSRAATVTITGRVQTQFNTSSVTGASFSEMLVRRARATLEVKINDLVSGKIQPDFAGGSTSLKDAYLRLSFSPTFRMTMGQFKRPFDVFELTSSTQILVIERAGGIRGVSACAGPGGVCSFSRFTEKLGYSDRDVGMMVDGTSGNTSYQFAMTNGEGANKTDINGTKSYSGRVRVAATDNIRIGGNFGVHDYMDPVTSSNQYGVAGGADIEVGNFSEGLHIQGGIVSGQNWANLDANGDASTFLSVQGIVTHKMEVSGSDHVSHIEPLGRISLGDPDTATDSDGGVLLTPGFVVHFVGRNKVAANIDFWLPGTGDVEWSLKFQSSLHF